MNALTGRLRTECCLLPLVVDGLDDVIGDKAAEDTSDNGKQETKQETHLPPVSLYGSATR